MQDILPLSYDYKIGKSQHLSVLGSTGSIGQQTLDIAKTFALSVEALACNCNIDLLFEQIVDFRPSLVSVANAALAQELKERLLSDPAITEIPEIMHGTEGNRAVASHPQADTVVAAIEGFAGLEPVLEALRLGRKIALANKETLVAAGDLVMQEARRYGSTIIPVDSEHAAIWQCMLGRPGNSWDKIFLTCSGGPFKDYSRSELEQVSLEDALKHPTWHMGAKITVDSASLMNKGMEMIEATQLFGADIADVEVVVHPQSVVHSMLSFADGSVMAVLGFPDMKLPILQALSFPEIIPYKADHPFNPFSDELSRMYFERANETVFPSLELARQSLRAGGLMPLVYNAANEAANLLFRQRKIRFVTIFDIVANALHKFHNLSNLTTASYDDILNAHEEVFSFIIKEFSQI